MFAMAKSNEGKETEGNNANSTNQRYGRTNTTFRVRGNFEGR